MTTRSNLVVAGAGEDDERRRSWMAGGGALAEVLDAVREIHKPSHVIDEFADYPPWCEVCEDKREHNAWTWPCPTAALVYNAEAIADALKCHHGVPLATCPDCAN